MAQRRLDIILLPLLRAPAHQYHKHLAVPSKVDAIAGAAIDPQFRDSFAKRLGVRGVALAEPVDSNRDPGRGLMVEGIEPAPERADIFVGDEFLDPDHMVPFTLPNSKPANLERAHPGSKRECPGQARA